MKKKLLILGLVIFLIYPRNAYAVSASIRCSAPGSVTVGQTFNVTITGSADAATYWNGSAVNSSSNLRSNSGTGSFVEQNSTTQVSKTYSFTALSEGTATVSQTMTISDEDYNEKSFTSNTCSISIVKPAETTNKTQASINNITNNKNTNKNNEDNKNLSSDNSLKSLSIEGIDMKPKFDKDTLEYSVELSNDTTSIKILAEKNDDTASVTGVGDIEVKEGNNVINVTVTAENGATRTYKINAYVKEKDPITVTINKRKYTVLKKLTDISSPLGFKEKTIKIKDIDIEAFYNEKLGYTIVGLKDSIGNINLYLYDEDLDKYSKYSPIVTEGMNIIVLDAPDKKIPHRYHKSVFMYNGKKIEGYALSEESDFRLIYGINVETGKKGYYLYDTKENTIQRFYNDQVNIYVELIKRIKLAFLILGGFILLQTLIIIVLLSKNVKFKKKYIEKRLSAIDNPIKENNVKYQDLEGTKTIPKEEFDDIEEDEYGKGKTFLDE